MDEPDEARGAEEEDAASGKGVAVLPFSIAWTGITSLFAVIVGVSTSQWHRKCSP